MKHMFTVLSVDNLMLILQEIGERKKSLTFLFSSFDLFIFLLIFLFISFLFIYSFVYSFIYLFIYIYIYIFFFFFLGGQEMSIRS